MADAGGVAAGCGSSVCGPAGGGALCGGAGLPVAASRAGTAPQRLHQPRGVRAAVDRPLASRDSGSAISAAAAAASTAARMAEAKPT
jgi:hypothetical protein